MLICLVALGLRFWYLDEARGQFDFERPVVDAGYHDYWAWGMASGEWALPLGAHVDPEIASRPYFRPPLTAYWMAGLFTLFGHDHLAARIVQILLGTAGCLVLMRLGTRVFDSATGIVAGFLAATYWTLIYFDLEYREVSLLAFLYPALALALLRWRERPSPARAAMAGALLGLSVLARPNGLVFVPAVLLWAWWITRDDRPTAALRHAGAFILAVAALVLPVTARNLVAGDDFVLVSSNGGINLFIGNNENATGDAVALSPELPPFDSAFDYREIAHRVGVMEGRALSDSEVSRWFARRALRYVADEPVRTLALIGRKAVAFWGGREIVSEKDLMARRGESTALRAVPLDVSFVLVTALLGIVAVAARRRWSAGGETTDRRGVLLLLVLVGTYFASLLPFFVTARFRAPMIPFLLVLSAFGLRKLFGLLGTRRLGAFALVFSALVAAYVLHRPAPVSESQETSRSIASDLAARGAQLATEGRLQEAEETLRRAVGADPENGMARNNLGLLLDHLGRTEEAIEHLRIAVELDASDPRPHQNLALALLSAGELQDALVQFARAAELAPLNPAVGFEAGRALIESGWPIFATEHLERARELAPGDERIERALEQARRATD